MTRDVPDSEWLTGSMPVAVDLPTGAGVYICYDDMGRIAYIGMSRTSVRARLQAHHRDPDKPALARWAAFYPGPDDESAAVCELKLIERHRPYLNRQHVEDAEPVQWERKPTAPPRRPWYESDPYWLWFMDGPGRVLPLRGSEPWQVAKVIRCLFEDGANEDDIWDACDVTIQRRPSGPAVLYLAAVVRNWLADQ